ncbi:MAG TPA: hypothetical protein VN645_08085 [Steroidobacteraceae bacterium]|nr:hypothetical protein [Steroidobacteraceae bacterium]
MEITNGNAGLGLVSRAVAFAMALTTTAFITTATAVVFTGSSQAVGSHLVGAVIAPIRTLIGV